MLPLLMTIMLSSRCRYCRPCQSFCSCCCCPSVVAAVPSPASLPRDLQSPAGSFSVLHAVHLVYCVVILRSSFAAT